ncbi:rho guanine nucleotide exchange factor 39 isoform X2 [Bufo bufo]|uniref:rho guanine nucleotide exchange factor 39 isoform X2 n=1 Tax=Bufo bufo TaxID=8384 RepID=UPI001ABE4E97|nr:rho guanine nucleotide exchange factor 39 isoform X2 [Bufo bufo]
MLSSERSTPASASDTLLQRSGLPTVGGGGGVGVMMRSVSAESPVRDQRRRWERKRGRTARELLETEREYVEDLELITKFYDEVFRVRCGSLALAQEGICGTIPSLVKVNRSLLMSLERDMAPSGFQTFSQYLHLYKKHADCMDATRHAVQTQVKKKKSFARFMKLQESRPEFQGRTLEQLLELPLQRVMRYRHYLLDLVENTFPDSPDSAHLNGALQAVCHVCDHIENMQQLQENDQQLQRVQKLLKGRRTRVLSPGRRFIREGWLSLVPPSGEEVKPRMLFLFSDILLVTAPCHPLHPFNAQKFCCRAVYPLMECQVEKVLGHTQGQGGLISLSFKREKLLFMSSNHQDMNGWYESLVMAVRKLHTDRYTRRDAPQRGQRTMTELQNVPAARAPKRHHVNSSMDVLNTAAPQEDPVCKRPKTSNRPEDGSSQPAASEEGSGWKCVIL